jgi:hypothetical protein
MGAPRLSLGRARAWSGQLLGSKHALADALNGHHDTLLGVRAGDERFLLQPILIRETALLRGQQRKDGLKRVQAEVSPLGDADAAADRPTFDPFHRHSQIEEAHLSHGQPA